MRWRGVILYEERDVGQEDGTSEARPCSVTGGSNSASTITTSSFELFAVSIRMSCHETSGLV